MIPQGAQKNLNSSTSFGQAAVTLLTQDKLLVCLGRHSQGTGTLFTGGRSIVSHCSHRTVEPLFFEAKQVIHVCNIFSFCSWVTAHPCNHAFAVQKFSQSRCSHLATPIFYCSRQNFDLNFSVQIFEWLQPLNFCMVSLVLCEQST